jgi:hypothetical protein
VRLASRTYWTLVVLTSALTLAGASMAASGQLRTPRHREVTNADGVGMYAGHIRHKVSNNLNGRALFNVQDLQPGWAGRKRIVLSNVGPQPFSRVTLTQDLVDTGGFSDALQLQIFDVTTNRCLYPRPSAEAVRRRLRATSPLNCERWMPWDGQKDLRFITVTARDGTLTWQRREQHLFYIRWRLDESSPNSDQGRAASFRLRWNTSG